MAQASLIVAGNSSSMLLSSAATKHPSVGALGASASFFLPKVQLQKVDLAVGMGKKGPLVSGKGWAFAALGGSTGEQSGANSEEAYAAEGGKAHGGSQMNSEGGGGGGIGDPSAMGFSLFPWQPAKAYMLPAPGSVAGSFPVLSLGAGENAAPATDAGARVPSPSQDDYPASQPLFAMTQSQAQGIILRAAMGTGWTTLTGLEGPSLEPHFPSPVRGGPTKAGGGGGGQMLPFEGGGGGTGDGEGSSASADEKRRCWPELTSSPRRTSRVKFTCNCCGARTVRAINPHAYEEGTVFVQCGGCLIFHKLVDNLNLFHELQGQVFTGAERGFGVHESVDILGIEETLFPPLPLN